MAPIRMAVIGVGHLGKEHARILAGLTDVELVGVVDVQPEVARSVAERLNTTAYDDYCSLLDRVDAATIVVPTTGHYRVARTFLERGIPVLVEKPLAATLDEAEQLVELAEKHDTILQVGHIERFNAAYEEVQHRQLQPKFITAARVGPFSGRAADVGVVLDLMIHDLDLLLDLVGTSVRTVEAVGLSVFGKPEDVANARLHFVNGCVAEVTASRISPAPSRTMHIWAPEGYASLDFRQRHLMLVQPSEQVRRAGLDPRRLDAVSLARLKEDLFGRHLEVLHLDCHAGDQLTRELNHFIQCVRTGQEPRVPGSAGLKALALADRILESIRTHRWEGRADGAIGPGRLPAPLAPLFRPQAGEAAA